MEYYDYWIKAYAVIFSLLIASLSLNSIFFIKDKVNKLLCFVIFSRIYALITSYFFERSTKKKKKNDFLPTFIYQGYRAHIFQGNLNSLITLIALALLIWKVSLKNKNRMYMLFNKR